MNFAILGLFSNNIYGIEGGIYTMLSHGLISSMLFFCIGMLYDRYGERNILYYSNIVQIMHLFSFFLLLFTVDKQINFQDSLNIRQQTSILFS